jgi:hypothetical protein
MSHSPTCPSQGPSCPAVPSEYFSVSGDQCRIMDGKLDMNRPSFSVTPEINVTHQGFG